MSDSAAQITIVGLGPGDAGKLTVQTRDLLRSSRVFLRTRIHPALDSIPESSDWPSFDHLYNRGETFADVYSAIVDDLLAAAESGPIVYAVPGHPLFGEATVRRLQKLALERDVETKIVPAVSFLDTVATAVGVDPVDQNIQLVDALELVAVSDKHPYEGGLLPLSPLRPAVIAQLYSTSITSAVKLVLLERYPEDFQVMIVGSAGTEQQEVIRLRLVELDHESVNHLSTLYVPALDPLVHNRVAEGMQQIIARLRAPGGCPWDREQTHESLTRHMIEEAYEAIQAIETGTAYELAEELGDVLLQVYLHAQIAEEAGDFDFEDVLAAVSSKLVRRHPHVFGDRLISSAGEVVKAWDQIKRDERSDESQSQSPSLFDTVPPSLPALSRAQSVLRRARAHGIDIDLGNDAVTVAPTHGKNPATDIGAELARIVALADGTGVDAEQALRRWTNRLIENASTPRAH